MMKIKNGLAQFRENTKKSNHRDPSKLKMKRHWGEINLSTSFRTNVTGENCAIIAIMHCSFSATTNNNVCLIIS